MASSGSNQETLRDVSWFPLSGLKKNGWYKRYTCLERVWLFGDMGAPIRCQERKRVTGGGGGVKEMKREGISLECRISIQFCVTSYFFKMTSRSVTLAIIKHFLQIMAVIT